MLVEMLDCWLKGSSLSWQGDEKEEDAIVVLSYSIKHMLVK